ncbi:MAG TPA: outer membrane beta-barrel protein [Candidatus Acidoferrum sp.]|nr:outer membrane beta-barrel protein [Candidatus Acidoferrum sp.]
MTKVNKWTLGLAAVGLVSLPAAVQAQSTTEKPNQLLTALSSTTISGYVDTSVHWNPGSGNANPAAISFNGPNKQDGFNLNVVNVVLEKPLDESTWSAGYKADLIYGPNAVGFNNSVGSAASDLSIKQAYVALRAPVGNGLDLKLGTWDTIIGYEVFNAGSNPNYTRSWGYTIEPTQHTGLLASYQVNKVVGLSAGVANTWNSGVNTRAAGSESQKTWMGAVTLTAPDSMGFLAGSALYLGIVDGQNTLVGNDATSFYAGATLATPIKGVKLGASFDYAETDDNGAGTVASASSYAAALYASISATEKLSFHFRGEYAKFNSAYATGGILNTGVGSVGGIPEEVLSFTGTIQYDLWANVLSRLEVRWDHAADGRPFGGSVSGTGIPGGADENDAVIVAANLIYKF